MIVLGLGNREAGSDKSPSTHAAKIFPAGLLSLLSMYRQRTDCSRQFDKPRRPKPYVNSVLNPIMLLL